MQQEFWQGRWQEGRIGFHLDAVNPFLKQWIQQVAPTPRRIFVPLCGKSQDLLYLENLGHQVVGVEFVEQAVHNFFEENGRTASCEKTSVGECYRSGNLEIHRADFFELSPELLGKVDGVYDRAALIALSHELRPSYAAHLDLLAADSPIYCLSLDYSCEKIIGPPFNVESKEIRELYSNRQMKLLSELQRAELNPNFASAGVKEAVEQFWCLEVLHA